MGPRIKLDRKKQSRSPRPSGRVGSAPGEKEAVGLRIIGGKLRGSRLMYAGDNRVRPMKDRVREAVFNLIGPTVRGKQVVDLFTGTGALAIEALSRGAVSATMIELHLPTAKNARNNIESLGLTEKCQLLTTDAFYWAKTRENFQPVGPWLLFLSPPYDFFVSRKKEICELVRELSAVAPNDSLWVIEADTRFDFAELPFSELPFDLDSARRRSYFPAEIGLFPILK